MNGKKNRITYCQDYAIFTVFTYIYFLLIVKDLCESQNISVKFPCAIVVYLCLSSGDLILSVTVFPFYSYFCVLISLSLSTYPHSLMSYNRPGLNANLGNCFPS